MRSETKTKTAVASCLVLYLYHSVTLVSYDRISLPINLRDLADVTLSLGTAPHHTFICSAYSLFNCHWVWGDWSRSATSPPTGSVRFATNVILMLSIAKQLSKFKAERPNTFRILVALGFFCAVAVHVVSARTSSALHSYSDVEPVMQRHRDILQETTTSSPTDDSTNLSAESHKAALMLLLLSLEAVAYLVGYFLHSRHFPYMQEAAATMLLGTIVGAAVRFGSDADLRNFVHFNSEFFFLVILPPIIFESGFNVSRRDFFYNITPVLMLAIVGTSVAAFATMGMLYFVNFVGWTTAPLSLSECLIFGALISSTDTVSVLAVFKQLRVEKDLYYFVFGESVLNDAVSIVLYRTARIFQEGETTLDAQGAAIAVAVFVGIFLGSIAVGVVIGLASSLLTKYTNIDEFPTVECSLLMIMAYASYLISEVASLSGIVAIMFCGIVMRHYTFANLSQTTRQMCADMFSVVAATLDTLVFIYLGLALFNSRVPEFDVGFLLTVIPIVLIARAIHVFPICSVANCTRPADRKLNWRFQTFIWFAGLRGAMAFALANDYNESRQTPQSAAIFTSTQITIVFTIVIMGAVTTPLVKRLRIPHGVNYERLSRFDVEEPNKVTGIDRKYIKPFFTKKVYKPRETGMQLETFESDNGAKRASRKNMNEQEEQTNISMPVSDLEAADKLAAAREILNGFEPMKGELQQQSSNNVSDRSGAPSRRKW